MQTSQNSSFDLPPADTGLRQRTVSDIWADVRYPLGVFLVTRLGLYFVVSLSFILLPYTNPQFGRLASPLVNGWASWDGSWYGGIAQGGYQCGPLNPEGMRNVAFFPLFPLAVRAVMLVVHDPNLAGLIVSNVSFLIALVLLFQIVRARFDEAVARRTVVLLAVFPFAMFFGAAYTKSITLVALVAAFFFGERRQWFLAGVCAAFASAARMVGVLLIPALALLYLSQIHFNWRLIRPNILWLGLGALGIGSYAAYLGATCGDPLLFAKSQFVAGWMLGVDANMAKGVIEAAPRIPYVGDTERREITGLLMHLMFAGWAIVLAALSWRLLPSAYALLATLMVFSSLSHWDGMGRYVVVIFPLFMVAALLLKSERWYTAVVYTCVLLLGLFATVFTHAYWLA